MISEQVSDGSQEKCLCGMRSGLSNNVAPSHSGVASTCMNVHLRHLLVSIGIQGSLMALGRKFSQSFMCSLEIGAPSGSGQEAPYGTLMHPTSTLMHPMRSA